MRISRANREYAVGYCDSLENVGLRVYGLLRQTDAGGLEGRVSVQMLPATRPLNPVGIADQAGLVK